jgi:hypothetical protein
MSDIERMVRRFFGAILIAVGVLIAVLAGGCTLLVLGFSFMQKGDAMTVIPMALLFGLPNFAIGLGLYFGGRALYRDPKPRADRPGA